MLITSITNLSGYADPHPVPWDWQNAPSNYPVFNSFPTNKANQPQFMHFEKNISIELGETANLPCSVKNLGKHTVSMQQDKMLLSILWIDILNLAKHQVHDLCS